MSVVACSKVPPKCGALKENTLYLPIRQIYFDQIIEGTKTEEFREVKEGDTATVEVVGFSFKPEMIRCDRDGNPQFCFWVISFHLGKVIKLHRK